MELRKFRSDFNLSQKDLAEVFGCKQSNISLIEKGERSVTGLQIRLLIERYGYDSVAKYAEPSELPAIPAAPSQPEISGNAAPVQNGDGNQLTSSDTDWVAILQQQLELNRQQSEHIKNLIEQQNRLIAIIENKTNV